MSHFTRRAVTASLLVLAAVLSVPAAALAAPPANDDWASRTTIPTTPLPQSATVTGIDQATEAATDAWIPCRLSGPVVRPTNTVFFSYTTGSSTQYVDLSTAGSNYDTLIGVLEGTPGSFVTIPGGCNDDGIPGTQQSRISGLRLEPNTTYTIEVGAENALAVPALLKLKLATSPQYNVTKTQDTADGVCNADCSLREAITASNASPGAVLVPAGGPYVLTRVGAGDDANSTGDLDVLAGMSIYGANGVTIDANANDRVFDVDPNASQAVGLVLADVTVTGGKATGDGGAIRAGAKSFLDLDHVVVDGGQASGDGGAISTVSKGRMQATTIKGASALGNGGGLDLPTAAFEVRDSTIVGNSAKGDGGGVGVSATGGRVAIVNSTISGNRADGEGGGIYASVAVVEMFSATIASNAAGTGDGLRLVSSSASIRNSVLAGGTDCSRTGSGQFQMQYTHVQNVAGGCNLTGTGVTTGDPKLDALAGNGGPTQTHGVQLQSPLVDTGDPAGCTDNHGVPLSFDQTGAARAVPIFHVTTPCDRGAFERPNAPPVCITPDFGAFEDQQATIEVCSDPDGTSLNYTLAAGHGTLTTPVGNEFKYKPAKDYYGPDTIDVTASDGVNPPVHVTLNVTVEPVNDEPTCDPVPDTTTPEDASVKIPLACTDVDRDTLTYTATALHGTMTGLVYHPESDYNGPDTVTLTVSDGEFTEPAVAQLTVTPVNDLPVCAPASATTAEEQSVTVTLSCTDVDSTVSYDGVSALHGTIAGSGATRTYTPNRDFSGTDTISFLAFDGVGQPVPGTVTVAVAGVNDAPVAVADAFSTTSGQVLANDTDADGDVLTAELVSGPAHGTLTLNPDGSFTYVPAAGFSGTDTFVYRARDASSASAPAFVVITVTGATVQPAAKPPVLSGLKAAQKGKALMFKVSAPAKVTVKLLRGKKVVKTIRVNGKAGTNTVRLKLKRGTYTVQLTAPGAKAVSKKLKLGA